MKKHTSFHEGWELMKEQLKKQMMESMENLSSQIYKLLEEDVEIHDLRAQIIENLNKLENYLPNVSHL